MLRMARKTTARPAAGAGAPRQRTCGTMQQHYYLLETNPAFRANQVALEHATQARHRMAAVARATPYKIQSLCTWCTIQPRPRRRSPWLRSKVRSRCSSAITALRIPTRTSMGLGLKIYHNDGNFVPGWNLMRRPVGLLAWTGRQTAQKRSGLISLCRKFCLHLTLDRSKSVGSISSPVPRRALTIDAGATGPQPQGGVPVEAVGRPRGVLARVLVHGRRDGQRHRGAVGCVDQAPERPAECR